MSRRCVICYLSVAVGQSLVFAFFVVVNFVDELSVPVAAYISFNRESGELPMSSHAQMLKYEPSLRCHNIKQAPFSNKNSVFPRFLNE